MKKFKLYILLALFVGVNGNFTYDDLPRDCGNPKINKQIQACASNGSAVLGEFPWIARIGVRDKSSILFYCSGSLIHPLYVVTAAHCGGKNNIVRLGENNLATEIDCACDHCAPRYQDIGIKHHLHDDHCRISNTRDMSILVLEKPAVLNDFVSPICLPPDGYSRAFLKKQRVITAGWGVTYSGWGTIDASKFTNDKDLHFAETPLVDEEECNSNYVRKLEFYEMCVRVQKNAKDLCVADSGGPLMTPMTTKSGLENRMHLIGMGSHNLDMCERGEELPAIYVDVSSYSKWIISMILRFRIQGFRK